MWILPIWLRVVLIIVAIPIYGWLVWFYRNEIIQVVLITIGGTLTVEMLARGRIMR